MLASVCVCVCVCVCVRTRACGCGSVPRDDAQVSPGQERKALTSTLHGKPDLSTVVHSMFCGMWYFHDHLVFRQRGHSEGNYCRDLQASQVMEGL